MQLPILDLLKSTAPNGHCILSRILSSLDVSNNRIKFVPNNAFVTLRLKTLKLSDNNLTLSEGALNGLEQSLKNLNLKGCHLKSVPIALRHVQQDHFYCEKYFCRQHFGRLKRKYLGIIVEGVCFII